MAPQNFLYLFLAKLLFLKLPGPPPAPIFLFLPKRATSLLLSGLSASSSSSSAPTYLPFFDSFWRTSWEREEVVRGTDTESVFRIDAALFKLMELAKKKIGVSKHLPNWLVWLLQLRNRWELEPSDHRYHILSISSQCAPQSSGNSQRHTVWQ